MNEVGVVIVVLVLVFVLPLWIVLHYVTRWRSNRSLSAEDGRMLGELWENAERMESRIHALERILDNEAPGWRNKR
jgi:phage shock protein B